MNQANVFVVKKDAWGRVVERGLYVRGRRVGHFEIMDFDQKTLSQIQYTDCGNEQILRSRVYAMVCNRGGDFVGRGDLLHESHRDADGTIILSTYEYVNGRRVGTAKQVRIKNGKPYPIKSHPGR
ncbi:hypothetical protein HDR63_02020 [bacterium]|nr:hypothetical protein [bacterium]